MTDFPPGFLWGSATAAAQIEGAAFEDGKEASIWDAFARVPGAVLNGDTLDVADDHYHRMPEDVALMKRLGLHAYRFSTSWSRIKPGDREFNRKGLDFYSRLVDELLANGIVPWLTLYHWDLPQAVQELGGWASRDTAYRFRDYAEGVYAVLGDRVTRWTTFNEPFCSSWLGYAAGVHAPGVQDPRQAVAAVHHLHLGHGLATKRLRELGAEEVGITLNLTNALPRDPSDEADLDAARRIDGLNNRIFLDPLLRGEYPEDVRHDLAEYGIDDNVRDGDLELISQPLDFLGVNHYHDDQVSAHPLEHALETHLVQGSTRPVASPFPTAEFVTFPQREGLSLTAMEWEVNPVGLTTLLVRLGREYDTLPALYVTENGAAYDDVVSEDGAIHDVERTAYIRDHIDAVRAAIEQGADVRGYFVWSLLDNFEWAWGYGKRFGIVRVDYDTLERTPKDSALAYASIIADHDASTQASPVVSPIAG
ncbi:beta-glucosidase [Humibacter sp. BT305]|uniref:beta-glucosidase n=1 Tax=Cnuibacter physcomitrellae TaxID=1619308 RepID=A0A1X9LQR2_9MICO|nr:family 1 glycosylhydrolase [Cnuibacter physcomitrellae]ARJ04240.1 beta-glucosidase [Cnuibacter physcomitrellae]AXH34081.1 beta-glucosidase [Humibacter sp. BT305]MCS5498115.1 family 1 glycosylhydrolase [Cnuibacter physcomitrellae]GGI40582.1 beta-glucosidase [Cnuibacter physcomitrellae]